MNDEVSQVKNTLKECTSQILNEITKSNSQNNSAKQKVRRNSIGEINMISSNFENVLKIESLKKNISDGKNTSSINLRKTNSIDKASKNNFIVSTTSSTISTSNNNCNIISNSNSNSNKIMPANDHISLLGKKNSGKITTGIFPSNKIQQISKK